MYGFVSTATDSSNTLSLTLLHSEQPKLHTVKAVLSAIGLKCIQMKIAEFANCVDPDEVDH